MFNKKAISPLVAVVLLILVVAIAGIAIYKWYKAQAGVVGEKTGGVIGEMAKGQAYLEITGLYVKPDGIYVVIRNTGTATASDIKLYIDNKLEPATFSIDAKDEIEIKLTTLNLEDINPGDVVTIKAVASNAPAQTRVFTAESSQWSSKMKDWNYRRKIRIAGSNIELEDYPVRIILNESNFNFEKSTGADFRFMDKSGNFLDYWVVEWNTTAKRAIILVKVPKIPTTGTEIYMYYGNSEARDFSAPEKVCKRIVDGLLVWYSFNSIDGCTVIDETGNGFNGHLGPDCPNDSPRIVEGTHANDNALEFDGSNDYMGIPHSAAFTNSFDTVHGPSTLEIIFRKGEFTGDWEYLFADGCPEWSYRISSSGNLYGRAYAECDGLVVEEGEWYHAVLVHEHTAYPDTVVKLFVNGREICQVPLTITTHNGYVNEGYNVGREPACSHGPRYYFRGVIDEIRIYNRALSDEEAMDLSESFATPVGNQLCLAPDPGRYIPTAKVGSENMRIYFE